MSVFIIMIFLTYSSVTGTAVKSDFGVLNDLSLLSVMSTLFQVIFYGDPLPWDKQENVIVLCNHQSSGKCCSVQHLVRGVGGGRGRGVPFKSDRDAR